MTFHRIQWILHQALVIFGADHLIPGRGYCFAFFFMIDRFSIHSVNLKFLFFHLTQANNFFLNYSVQNNLFSIKFSAFHYYFSILHIYVSPPPPEWRRHIVFGSVVIDSFVICVIPFERCNF